MKKIITMASLMVAAVSLAQEWPTVEQIRTVYNQTLEIAATNTSVAYRIAYNQVIIPLNENKRYPGQDALDLAAEADTAYSALKFAAPANWATAKDTRFPKASMISFVQAGIETNCPYVVSLGREKEFYCSPWSFSENNATIEELIGIVNECLSLKNGKLRPMYDYVILEHKRKSIQKLSVKYVKKYLRRQGKSFVTKDGVNPCEGLMTELNTALNAPYFNGLNEWFQKIGINASVDVSKIPNQAEVLNLKNAIMDADKDMTSDDTFILKVALGVDGYNAFVKEYNGEQ